MEEIKISNLIEATGGKLLLGNPGRAINSVSIDTRTLKKDDVFFALKGKNFDGHKFVGKAFALGASAAVVSGENDYGFPGEGGAVILVKDTFVALGDFAGFYRKYFNPLVIGITGSNGKTTTKEMIFSVLKYGGKTLANKGNFNNLVGLPLTLLNLNAGYKYCILELGISLKGEMDRLLQISSPDIGVITNIGRTHLEFLKDTETVFSEKRKLLESLPADGGVAVLNRDVPYTRKLEGTLRCRTLTYSLDKDADIRGCNPDFKEVNKTRFGIQFDKSGSIDVTMNITGIYNVYNALAAASVCYAAGMDTDSIRRGLEDFSGVSMRWEEARITRGSILINDAYNANPDSMSQALSNFDRVYGKMRKIAVLGDMLELGEKSRKEHMELGVTVSLMNLDKVYLLGRETEHVLENIPVKPGNRHFKNENELLAQLIKDLETGEYAVFFKASHGIGLDKTVKKLVEYFGKVKA